MTDDDKPTPQAHMWTLAGRFGALGIEMDTGVAIGALGGNWLDKHFDCAPVCLILGFVVGIGASVTSLLRVVRDFRAQAAGK